MFDLSTVFLAASIGFGIGVQVSLWMHRTKRGRFKLSGDSSP
jgi:hypothetical protein